MKSYYKFVPTSPTFSSSSTYSKSTKQQYSINNNSNNNKQKINDDVNNNNNNEGIISNYLQDLPLLVIMIFYIYACPFTKVEESFNIQAIHDLLNHGSNIENFDHLEFPGVVPRSFIGSLFISFLSYPLVRLSQLFGFTKLAGLYICRFVLGMSSLVAISHLRRTIGKAFGSDVGYFFSLVTMSQFHFIFYSSRTLPNTFALILVIFAYSKWLKNNNTGMIVLLSMAMFLFRSEVLILSGPIIFSKLLNRSLAFGHFIKIGIISASICIISSIIIDSLFWNRLLYPELEVFLFNTLENKSSEWGVLPFGWYFKSAIPKSLLLWSLFFIPALSFTKQRQIILPYLLPIVSFIFIYSFLPHKELRFILYVVPIFNLTISIGIKSLFTKLQKYKLILWTGLMGLLFINLIISMGFLYVSSKNYSGGDIFTKLHSTNLQLQPLYQQQQQQNQQNQENHNHILNYSNFTNNMKLLQTTTTTTTIKKKESLSIHIDNLAAMSGVSRFGELNSNYKYSKQEYEVQFKDYDVLVTPFKEEMTLQGFKVSDWVNGFSHITISKSFPFISIIEEPTFTSMGLTLKGDISTTSNWVFIDKFCISDDGATVSLNVDFGTSRTTKLLLYSDSPKNWGKVQSRDLSCYEKIGAASTVIGWNSTLLGRVVPVNQQRDRWWYVAFANCERIPTSVIAPQINISSYEIVFKNQGDGFDRAISADQHGIPQTQLFFFIFYLMMLICVAINILFLWRRQLESSVMRLFFVVVLIKAFGLFISLIYWGIYLKEDHGNNQIYVAGFTFDVISRAFFILVLLLLAQGWTISHHYGSVVSRAVSAIIFVCFLIASVCIYLVPNATYMPLKTYVFYYDTVPGYILLAMFLCIFGWFLCTVCRSSSKHNHDILKKRFFQTIAAVFSFWFILLPVVIITSHFLNNWVRCRAVTIFSLVIDAVFYIILTVLFRGSKSNSWVHVINLDQNSKGIKLEDKDIPQQQEEQEK
ncbi:glycosyltransferase [Cavenderia fasciculata]|uniref:Mannosyltransferase n=1 Tax=Cavenderia fasciculata TaxID=261658 RepID=F4Q2P0_CACFS|nr:glycosyltransferase [Cavenderia fasciculata]EGG17507.1 glycosyltransferase [Cavenderia fasciculata]|eukprot:XP_004355991.1 glycosyltransferase [Cavenderia fasciculata]